MATTMTYGDYGFSPVPLMQITVTNQKTGDGTSVGQLYNISLDGTLTSGAVNYSGVDALQDALTSALSQDGKRFHITCDGAEILDVYPRINTFTFEPTSDNWVQRSDYTIELEFDGVNESNTDYVSNTTENWTIEFINDQEYFSSDLSNVSTQYAGRYYGLDVSPYSFRISHDVSAVGKKYYSTTGVCDETGTLSKEAWQEARDYVLGKLGADNTFLQASGVINLNVNDFQYYNHIRSQQTDEAAGSFGVTESWIVINPSGTGIPGNVLENFNVDVHKEIGTDLTNVTINGTIQGLATINYGITTGDFSISESKYQSAQSGWNVIKNRLLSRAQLVSQDVSTRPLNSGVYSHMIGYSPARGSITYNYQYNDRPTNCISGALSESISISDTNPTDVFASLTVLGRAAGPVLQDINTVTASTRDVSINAVMTVPTGCTVANLLTNKPTAQVNSILCAFETDLTGNYDSVFLQQDNENWNPKTGSYSRAVRWVYTNCIGTNSTSFCS